MLWSAWVTGFLVFFWTAWGVRFGAPAWVGPLYPLGALLVSGFLRAAEWAAPELNGRSYAWDPYSDVGDNFPPSEQPSGPVSAGADPLD